MSKHKCCVPLCFTTIKDGIPLHSFPNPDEDSERFRLWVLKIGGDIIGLDNKAIFKYRRVCHKHFASNFLYLSNHISKTAVPQLLLPAPHRLNTITTLVHLSTSPVEQELANVDIEPVPSTSQMSVKTSVPEKRHLSGQSKVSQIEQTNARQIMKQITTAVKRRTRMGSVQLAKRISKMKAFNILTTEMSENAKKFFFMQVTQSKKKMKGRRFTLDEKILALSLYKPSPKAYRMLQKFCVLPSRRCLQSLLQTVSLRPGCNDRIFSHLKKRVAKMPEKHRYCTLVFDEMAIARSCSFNTGKDIIEGFVNDGENTESTFCDHVLVFMIRGVVKKYKQPVWFSFSSGTTKTLTLKNQIKAVIKQLLLIKLKVIATVCDQGATNIAAINSLISDTKAHYLRTKQEYTGTFFEMENKKIFVLYDPPHIMKGIRNNLLNKNLKFTMDGKEKTAKWEHINALYERSPGYKGVKIVPKLTAHHIVPHLIPKMKVKLCTQVFSKSVGAALGFMAESGCLPKESTETADLLIFFDELFDSVNGNFHQVVGGKIYRTAVTPKSPHHKLWRKSLPVLKSMKFDMSLKRGVVPSITSWV